MARNIWNKLRENICSTRFWLAVLLYVLICFCAKAIEWTDNNPPSLLYMTFFCTKEQLSAMGEQFSAYMLLMSFQNMEWYIVILPVLVSFLSVYNFYDEWFGGIYYMSVTRTSRVSYALQSLISAVLTAVAVSAVAILLFALLLRLKFPSYDSMAIEPNLSIVGAIYGMTVWERLLTFLKMYLNILLVSAVMAEITILFLLLLRDCFFSLTIPMMLNYIGYKVLHMHLIALRERYGLDYAESHMRWEILNPVVLIGMDRHFEDTFSLHIAVYFLALLSVVVLLLIGMTRLMRARSD